ncbi:MAG: M23 family metallopeptidase [Candidatus Azotimanducaceae bacterium WSBS_2022_MAG_OTU7]
MKNWMSSHFGHENKPDYWKAGLAMALILPEVKRSDVISVAAGIVVYADDLNGYGKMVEIHHGGGYTTRYGHHQKLKVKSGDIVRKGEVIGLMGSSGRSTGPHVHFEVYKNGRRGRPLNLYHRASR